MEEAEEGEENHISAWQMGPVHLIWTKIDLDMHVN